MTVLPPNASGTTTRNTPPPGTRPISADACSGRAVTVTTVSAIIATDTKARRRVEPLVPAVLPNLATITDSQHDLNGGVGSRRKGEGPGLRIPGLPRVSARSVLARVEVDLVADLAGRVGRRVDVGVDVPRLECGDEAVPVFGERIHQIRLGDHAGGEVTDGLTRDQLRGRS